ncbi:MAG: flavin reductase [Chloroflexia bacterium]|nr:flavin reductase [Chloroflexia bacterium]
MSDASKGPEQRNRSGGGIVFGGGTRALGAASESMADVIAGLRRRWASGVAIVTATDADGRYRGVTASSLMVVSQAPPILAIALTEAGSFQRLALEGGTLGVSILESTHEFAAERFAGRAPIPDARFAGIDHRLEDGVPILNGALAWCVGRVASRQEAGDHVLLLLEVTRGGLEPDTDDPLLSYEGRYRRLEAG